MVSRVLIPAVERVTSFANVRAFYRATPKRPGRRLSHRAACGMLGVPSERSVLAIIGPGAIRLLRTRTIIPLRTRAVFGRRRRSFIAVVIALTIVVGGEDRGQGNEADANGECGARTIVVVTEMASTMVAIPAVIAVVIPAAARVVAIVLAVIVGIGLSGGGTEQAKGEGGA
jgi:hypothetical protein